MDTVAPFRARTRDRSAIACPAATGQAAPRRSSGDRAEREFASELRKSVRDILHDAPPRMFGQTVRLYCTTAMASSAVASTEDASGHHANDGISHASQKDRSGELGSMRLSVFRAKAGFPSFEPKDGAFQRVGTLVGEEQPGRIGILRRATHRFQGSAHTICDDRPSAALRFKRDHPKVFVCSEKQGATATVLLPKLLG